MNCSLTGRSLAALPGTRIRIEVVEELAALPEAWSQLVPLDHPLLARPMLDAAVATAPENTLCRFVMAWDGDELRAVALIEAVPLQTDALGQITTTSGWPLRTALHALSLAHCGKPYVMLCGDALRTDVAGCYISFHESTSAGLLHQMLEAARRQLSVSVALVVCSARGAGPSSDALVELGYRRIDKAEPPMQVDLMPEWKHWSDYLQAMRKKYRQRARSARKKGQLLTRTELDVDQIRLHADAFDDLLSPLLDRASVTLVRPTAQKLPRLKATLGDRLTVRAYHHQDKLVAFSSSIHTADTIEGFLVGFDDQSNHALKLYQNILYDFIEEGLAHGARSVCLGRTALEIKSAVGATPTEVPLYVRHPSALMHPVLGWAAKAIPDPSWTARHPFRHEIPAAAR